MNEDFLTQRCALVGFPDGLRKVRSWGFPKWSTFSRQAHQDKERKGFLVFE